MQLLAFVPKRQSGLSPCFAPRWTQTLDVVIPCIGIRFVGGFLIRFARARGVYGIAFTNREFQQPARARNSAEKNPKSPWNAKRPARQHDIEAD
jgi:hypothetical protein